MQIKLRCSCAVSRRWQPDTVRFSHAGFSDYTTHTEIHLQFRNWPWLFPHTAICNRWGHSSSLIKCTRCQRFYIFLLWPVSMCHPSHTVSQFLPVLQPSKSTSPRMPPPTRPSSWLLPRCLPTSTWWTRPSSMASPKAGMLFSLIQAFINTVVNYSLSSLTKCGALSCFSSQHWRGAGDQHHGQAVCQLWPGDPQDCPWPGLNRGGRQVRGDACYIQLWITQQEGPLPLYSTIHFSWLR